VTLAKLLNTPCTILRRSASGAEDSYGNPIETEEEIETVAEIQQQQRSEAGDAGELSDTAWLGVFPAGTDLRTGDAVRIDGIGGFELVGDPWPARNPRTQQASHVEASLRRTMGSEEAS
jgi:nucleoid DNA-binding protein